MCSNLVYRTTCREKEVSVAPLNLLPHLTAGEGAASSAGVSSPFFMNLFCHPPPSFYHPKKTFFPPSKLPLCHRGTLEKKLPLLGSTLFPWERMGLNSRLRKREKAICYFFLHSLLTGEKKRDFSLFLAGVQRKEKECLGVVDAASANRFSPP